MRCLTYQHDFFYTIYIYIPYKYSTSLVRVCCLLVRGFTKSSVNLVSGSIKINQAQMSKSQTDVFTLTAIPIGNSIPI